jgi:hypothetical protein
MLVFFTFPAGIFGCVFFLFSEVFVRVYAGFGTLFHRHKKGGEGNQRYG